MDCLRDPPGTFDDLKATGRHVEWKGSDWVKLRSGRIVKVWAYRPRSVAGLAAAPV
jgi:hypothetical protein